MQNRYTKGRTEEEFLASYHPEKYPRPFLTADIVLLSREQDGVRVLLVRRKNHPYIDCWALPGGFAQSDETIEQSAARELREETGVAGLSFYPVGLFSAPGRDPRGWVVSQAYAAWVDRRDLTVHADDDAADAKWFLMKDDHLENGDISLSLCQDDSAEDRLAFDHAEIIKKALILQD